MSSCWPTSPNARLLNLTGKSFGTTSLTLWDDSNRPVTFLVRVTVDTKEVETRVNQAFPGAQVKVRQVGSQIILDGQVPEAKMMADILQVVMATVRTSRGFQGTMGGMTGGGGGAMGGAGGGMAGGAGGMGGGMAGGMGGGMAGGMGGGMAGGMAGGMGLTIINRVVIPGPRQILLHVKIAVLNRTAIRQLGISWLDAKGNSIVGSTAGQIGTVAGTVDSTATPPSSYAASSGGQLFGIFDAAHFSLFINALRSNALAKILAEPNLMALDGQPARFLAGGVFPFPVPQSSSIPGGTAVVTVQLYPFGTSLIFIPQILPNDVIRLDVEPSISQLNKAEGTTVNGGAAPAIDMRSAPDRSRTP